MIIRVKKSINYSVISNQALRDPSLSAKAKGLFAYVMTLPNDWKLYVRELCKHFTDGRDSIYNGLKELIAARYLLKRVIRKEGRYGGVEYIFRENPDDCDGNSDGLETPPLPEYPDPVSSNLEDPPLLNTDSNQILTTLNTEGASAPGTGNPKDFVDEYHKHFVDKTTTKPILNYPKEIRIYKSHLKAFGLGHQRVMAALSAFFEDPWQASQGYNLAYFWRQIQKYLLTSTGIEVSKPGPSGRLQSEYDKALEVLKKRDVETGVKNEMKNEKNKSGYGHGENP